ncbi:MAG: hypothetical protein U1E62_22370 [Alsobacter sp.]
MKANTWDEITTDDRCNAHEPIECDRTKVLEREISDLAERIETARRELEESRRQHRLLLQAVRDVASHLNALAEHPPKLSS